MVAPGNAIVKKFKNTIRKHAKKIVKYIGYKLVLPLVYKWYARKPIDEKLVVFADHRDRDMPDNFLGLYSMCQKNGFQCEVLSGRPFGNKVPKWRRRKEKLKFQFWFIKLFAQCQTLFLVEYFPLAYIVTPRTGTAVVQLWHGCGLMKRMGYAVTSNSWGISARELKRYPMHTSYTLVCASSSRVCKGYEEAFCCGIDLIKPLGSPRTDIYFNEKFRQSAREKVRAMIPDIGDREIILYAPTFRGKSISKSYIKSELNYTALKEALSDKYVFLTKFHPLIASTGFQESNRLQGLGFAYDVSKKLTPEESLCAADILITDYSSIIFEFLLLERPVISYIYDIDDYIEDRGLFSPYEQLAPGPYVFTQEELIKKLRTVSEWFDIKKTRQYKEEFMSACDGHSTERIYRYVFGQEPVTDSDSEMIGEPKK